MCRDERPIHTKSLAEGPSLLVALKSRKKVIVLPWKCFFAVSSERCRWCQQHVDLSRVSDSLLASPLLRSRYWDGSSCISSIPVSTRVSLNRFFTLCCARETSPEVVADEPLAMASDRLGPCHFSSCSLDKLALTGGFTLLQLQRDL